MPSKSIRWDRQALFIENDREVASFASCWTARFVAKGIFFKKFHGFGETVSNEGGLILKFIESFTELKAWSRKRPSGGDRVLRNDWEEHRYQFGVE